MKKKFMGIVIISVITIISGWNYNQTKRELKISDIVLVNVEALANGEGSTFGCGYAAYEWDDDWYEDTKSFTKCRRGCPEGEGTSPKYMDC